MRGGWSLRGTVLKKISHNHFSFIKGLYLGFDEVAMYERYIAFPDAKPVDPRVIPSIQKWITAELIRLAGRHNRKTGIRLLKYDPVKINPSPAMSESLEEFEDRMGISGFYTQSELLKIFEEHYANNPEIRAKAKQARIRQRQLELIAHLVAQESVQPGPQDLIAGWLEPSLTRHFEAAGVTLIGQLVEGINALGFNWHRKIPGIGAKAANHIIKWLSDEEVATSLGIKIATSALLPPALLRQEPIERPLSTAVVPFESFLVPEALNGSLGENLHAKASRQASNDKEAIDLWLRSVKPGPTFRAYRKEAERFLLWAILERKKPFSSLALDDCIAYRNFLNALGRETPLLWHQQFTIAQDQWIGPRGFPRRSTLWKPFEGKLSNLSQKYALGVLSTLCEFLVKIRYLDSNPFVGLTLITNVKNKIHANNALLKSEIEAIKAYLAPRQKDPKYRRIQLILVLGLSTGMRISELASLRKSLFTLFMREDGETRWKINLVGKGQKEREVELSPVIMEHLEEYFYLSGLTSFTGSDDETPVIASLSNHKSPLGHDRIYKVLKDFFKEVAITLPSPAETKRLTQASTHWLRHSFATNALASGMPIDAVMAILGHASQATTAIYTHTDSNRRSRLMDEFIDKSGF